MGKPNPYTFTTNHRAILDREVAKLMATSPTEEQIAAFAAAMPTNAPHVEACTYNAALKRFEVRLVGGRVAFPLPLPELPEPDAMKARASKVEEHPDGSVGATFAPGA